MNLVAATLGMFAPALKNLVAATLGMFAPPLMSVLHHLCNAGIYAGRMGVLLRCSGICFDDAWLYITFKYIPEIETNINLISFI